MTCSLATGMVPFSKNYGADAGSFMCTTKHTFINVQFFSSEDACSPHNGCSRRNVSEPCRSRCHSENTPSPRTPVTTPKECDAATPETCDSPVGAHRDASCTTGPADGVETDAGPCDMAWGDITTVMMRNLPNKYTQRMLVTEIAKAGFESTFNFLYVPIDHQTQANRGYAFINFLDAGTAWDFKMAYDQRKMKRFNSNKLVTVTPAAMQGYDANREHYADSRVARSYVASRPLFIRESGQGAPERRASDPTSSRRKSSRGRHGKGARQDPPEAATHSVPAPAPTPSSMATPALALAPLLSTAPVQPVPVPTSPGQKNVLAQRFCTQCASPVVPTYKFCPCCGESLDLAQRTIAGVAEEYSMSLLTGG